MKYTKNITTTFILESLFSILCLSLHACYSLETDILTSGSSIKHPDSIVSAARKFKLGFFTPPNTTNTYLAVYYFVSENTPIWIANPNNPITNPSLSTLTISHHGNLVLTTGPRNETVWSTNATSAAPRHTSAQILDTGNLVLRETSTGHVIWDCFSHPSNTFLPTMRLTDNPLTGRKITISSWKSPSDPRPGNYTAGLSARGIPQIFTWKNGQPHYRSGPWNGIILIGIQDMYSPYLDGFQVGNEPSSGNVFFVAPPKKFLMKIEVNSTGSLVKTLWDDQTRTWDAMWVAPRQECDVYGKCGPNGLCNPLHSPVCDCLRGFEPVSRAEWGMGNWTSGCVRRTDLRCGDDRFLRMPFVKVPDFAEQFPSRVEDECRVRCLENCSCLAYSHDLNIGCMFWRGELVDIQQFDGVGPDFHIRLASSELGDANDGKLVRIIIIIVPVVVGLAAIAICIFMVLRWMAEKKGGTSDQGALETSQSDSSAIVLKDESEKVNIQELPVFTFKTLSDATNQFHYSNMLGRGGFGYVYKGMLANGKKVAVKRLSANSGQGWEEFRNEAVVISKVQHRNLVKLLGCCAEREEKMLVYEYMPNKSLDVCLFDPENPSKKILDWKKRFSIVEGIGRGLMYLHMDSRLKIIHRDLKPSNVLLDEDYNPKISDFGMARIFGGNQDQANTARVVGTYGYMAPEYAMDGRFSDKTDVYSFGVLMLEIASGKKNTHYYNPEWSLSLIGCAWKSWNEGKGMAFADQTIADPSFEAEIVRCIHIALLCVQESPNDRPSVQAILSMLSCEIVDLPIPEQPVFAEKWNRSHVGSTQPTGQQLELSVNGLTITVLEGR